MKVEGPGKAAQNISKNKKSQGKSSTDFDSLVKQSAEAGTTHAAQQIEEVQAPPSTEDSLTGRSPEYQEAQHAEKLLDQLEQLHLGLLSGGVSTKTLNNISSMVQRQRQNINDEKLLEILDEIDLRAQVELAKHSQK